MKVLLFLTLLTSAVIAYRPYKILMFGDVDPTRAKYFLEVALLNTNKGLDFENDIYLLSLEEKRLQTREVSNYSRVYYLGLPEPYDIEAYEWDREDYEENNFLRLEMETIKLVFSD